jgi:hypothetical protein
VRSQRARNAMRPLRIEDPMRISVSFALIFLCILAASNLQAHDAVQTNFTVMTRNVYVGADLTKIVTGSGDIFENMRDVFRRVRRTDFEERAVALADEIEAHKPLLVGLQEVALWRTETPANGPFFDATHVEFDFLQILLDELQSRGLNYESLVVFNGFDIEAPGEFSNGLMDVRFTDRSAIIGRVTHHFDFVNLQKDRYDKEFSVPTGFFDDIDYKRGWQSVDVKIVGSSKKFRFINTHLEVFSGSVNEQQAEELLNGRADTSLPVIVVGDLNAAPNDPQTEAREMFLDAGFQDAWSELKPGSAGRTCCQRASLKNEDSKLTRRIDYVMVKGAIGLRGVSIVGESPADKTESGLWPSDHAGVAARLRRD